VKRIALLIAVLLTACGGSSPTAPASRAVDPTALIRNTSASPMVWYWFDGSTQSGRDSIPPYTTRCEHFLAQPDSARYEMVRSDSVIQGQGGIGGWNWYSSNWFDPTSRPAWTIDNPPTLHLLVKDTTATPC